MKIPGIKLPGNVRRSLMLAVIITLSPPLKADTTAATKIQGRIKASCSLTVPPVVRLGEINRTAIENDGSEMGVSRYAQIFYLSPTCHGTQKFRLTFRTEQVTTAGCADAESGAMAFCLYHDDKLINLSGLQGSSIEGTTNSSRASLTVMPGRGSKAPVVGEHSASVTATIAPI